jgi:hypothetical protein
VNSVERKRALLAGLMRILREARDHEIDEAYRRGYGKYPQEEWIGEVGRACLIAFDRDDRAGNMSI